MCDVLKMEENHNLIKVKEFQALVKEYSQFHNYIPQHDAQIRHWDDIYPQVTCTYNATDQQHETTFCMCME